MLLLPLAALRRDREQYPSELEYRSEIEDRRKYIKRSTAAQWGVQKPYLEYIRGLWGVQKYKENRKMLL
jgi:hypothetical protein